VTPSLEANPVACYKVCGPPPIIINGTHFGPDNPRPGTEITYSCVDGYFSLNPSSDKFTTVCLENGNYTLGSDELVSCAKIACNDPPEISNGKYIANVVENYAVNQVVSFTCNASYLPDPSVGFISCGAKGWVKIPKCIKVCDAPPEIKHGIYTTSTEDKYIEGEVAMFKCSIGFFANPTDNKIKCGHFGWEDTALCETGCGEPPKIEKARREIEYVQAYKQVGVLYHCDETTGFITFLLCIDGTWDGHLGECLEPI